MLIQQNSLAYFNVNNIFLVKQQYSYQRRSQENEKSSGLSASMKFRRMVLGTGNDSLSSVATAIAWGVGTCGIAPTIALLMDIFCSHFGEHFDGHEYHPSIETLSNVGLNPAHDGSCDELLKLDLPQLKMVEQALNWLDDDPLGKQATLNFDGQDSATLTLDQQGLKINGIAIMTIVEYLHIRLKKDPNYLAGKNLHGYDLSGIDLTGANITGTDFSYTTLKDAILNTDLSGATFSLIYGINLSKVKPDQIHHLNGKLKGTIGLIGALDNGIKLSDLDLTGLILTFDEVAALRDHPNAQPVSPSQKINLRGINLSKENFSYANFSNCDLSYANLYLTNLSHANLSKANLTSTSLNRGNLNSANLSYANLSSAELNGASLIKTNLSHAKLNFATLNGSILSDTILTGAVMTEANCNATMLYPTDFNNIKDLHTVKLNNLTRIGRKQLEALCELNRIAETNGKPQINLKEINLNRRDMKGANLAGLHLVNPWLEGTCLEGANLSNIKFQNAELIGAKINSDTDFTGASISLKIPLTPDLWDAESLDRHFNHISNPDTGSLLTVINAIDDKYKDLKINLMHQIIDALKWVDIAEVQDPMMNQLMNSIYFEDKKICEFIENKVILPKIKAANSKVLNIREEKELLCLLSLVAVKGKQEQEAFMLSNNSFFVQLLAKGIGHADPLIKEKAEQLYGIYMDLEELREYKDHTLFDGSDDIKEISKVDQAFVFFKRNQVEGTRHALLLSQNQLAGMLEGGADPEFENIYYLKNSKNVTPEDSANAYKPFPLLSDAFVHYQNKAGFSRLLHTINLNFTNPGNHPEMRAKNYSLLFNNVLGWSSSDTKLVNAVDQLALGEIFTPLLDITRTKININFDNKITTKEIEKIEGITHQHFWAISRIYGFENRSQTEQAKYLFCLAAMFTAYSSSYFFGQEWESPEALRKYALGLLVTAHNLDQTIFINKSGIDMLPHWTNILLGEKGAFTCTAVLKSAMKSQAQSRGFNDIMVLIKPPGW